MQRRVLIMDYKYVLVESSYSFSNQKRTFYGIAIIDSKDCITILDNIIDISDNKDSLRMFVEECNKNRISMEHFIDVVEDYVQLHSIIL